MTAKRAEGEHKAIAIAPLTMPLTVKSARRTLGKIFVIGGAALAATGVGFGMYARSQYNAQFDNGQCINKGNHPQCMPMGQTATETARTWGSVGTGIGIA